MYWLQKWQISLVGIALLIIFVAALSRDDKNSLAQLYEELNAAEYEDFQKSLLIKDGFFDQVGEELKKQGYENNMLGMFHSKEEVWVKYVLVDKEATKQEQKEVETIFFEMAIEYNLDPSIFKVKVSNEDSPEW